MTKTSKPYHIVNYMEELVTKTLQGLIADMPQNEKPSARIEADIKALALNRLWPMYVTTDKGRHFVRRDVVSDKIDRDVAREIQAAIELVNRNPR